MNVGSSLFKTAHRPATGAPRDRKRRVLIVDDHPIVRQGLRRLIEAELDLEVCGESETARDAKSLIANSNRMRSSSTYRSNRATAWSW